MLTGGGMGGMGGGRAGPPGVGGRGGGGGGGAAAARVVAVGDDRSNSLVISAPADLVTAIETMVSEIDQEVADATELRVFRLANADPSETADQLSSLFPDPTTSTSAGQINMPSFMRSAPGGSRGRTTATGTDSERAKKMGRVLAVPDPRTSALIVMASKTLMPQIAEMITELDSDRGRKEVVGFYDLQNANPQDVQAALQDLFNRNTRVNNNNQNLLLGNNNPLNKRIQQSQQTTSGTTSVFGGGGRGSSMGGGF
jgi:hypothetical protein